MALYIKNSEVEGLATDITDPMGSDGMVLGSSAVVAIFLKEPGYEQLVAKTEEAA